ncbi:hypothetical protein G3A43_06550 [Paraburkholderia aspalathi]|nr:hypothetical protein [Paraburkholderia aspalathi]MBK3779909.1 hypothetical protein [Paraburkholderia aspalathi]
MGQAKNRGSREVRIAQAQATQAEEEPINVPCNTCKEVLNGFTLIKNTPAGAAWQKQCTCGAITTALVQAKDSTLQRAFKATLGMTDEITGGEKKVSVSFLEKNLDTIETGLVRLG